MQANHRFTVRTWIALAAFCAGGLLPGTCAIRTKRAIVDGSKSFLSDVLLNPANLADLAAGTTPDDETDNGDDG